MRRLKEYNLHSQIRLYRRPDVGFNTDLFGELLTVKLGRIDQIGEGSFRLRPLAGLETAIRVDPKLIRLEVSVANF
jgi:hypothetical protein